MSEFSGRRDDQTGQVSETPNPAGWLNVIVTPLYGGTSMHLDFQSWTSFRHWVELSDPACAQSLDIPKIATGP